jgi:amidase
LRATGPFGAGTRSYRPVSLTVAIDRVWGNQAGELATYTKSLLLLGEFARREFNGATYAKAHNVRSAFVRAYDDALEQVDVLAIPACLGPAPPVFERLPFAEGRRRQIGVLRQGFDAMIRNTAPFNYTGHPAIALPCGTVGRLPFSMQLVSRRFDEPTLLRIARAYERLHDH